jgi:hypothetical protein
MRYQGSAAISLALMSLTACAHNDVLVFGTDTKLGVDVETSAAQGASPSVTIGYKRKEAVWMPLFVNGKDSRYALCSKAEDQPKCTIPAGTAPAFSADVKYQSTQPDGSKDAYSVFASLGANIQGSAAKPNASVGLAQFFATGGAAINISKNAALMTALKVESAQGAEAQADAIVAATGAQGFDALIDSKLSVAERDAILQGVHKKIGKQKKLLSEVSACSRADDGTWRWELIVDAMLASDGALIDSATKGYLKGVKNEAELEAKIGDEREYLDSAKAAAISKNFCK